MHGLLKFSGRTSSRSANGVVHSRGDERESDRQEVGVGATPSESALSERAQKGQSTLHTNRSHPSRTRTERRVTTRTNIEDTNCIRPHISWVFFSKFLKCEFLLVVSIWRSDDLGNDDLFITKRLIFLPFRIFSIFTFRFPKMFIIYNSAKYHDFSRKFVSLPQKSAIFRANFKPLLHFVSSKNVCKNFLK